MSIYNFSCMDIKDLYSLTHHTLLIQTNLSDKLKIKEINLTNYLKITKALEKRRLKVIVNFYLKKI